MLIVASLLLSAGVGVPSPVAAAPSIELRQCPDGAVIRAADACAAIPEHRYEMSHEPARRDLIERWSCGTEARANQAQVTIEQRRSGSTARLVSLIANGRSASPSLIAKVRRAMAEAPQAYQISSRCLYVRAGEATGVLVLHHLVQGQQRRLEIVLR